MQFPLSARCKCQDASKKAQSPSCLCSDLRNMLTPVKIVGDGDTKVFGGLNMFQYLILKSVVE